LSQRSVAELRAQAVELLRLADRFDALADQRERNASTPARGRQRGCQRIVKARTVHGAYGAEMRELRRLMWLMDEEQRGVLELVK
jgi:hypothetical protein